MVQVDDGVLANVNEVMEVLLKLKSDIDDVRVNVTL